MLYKALPITITHSIVVVLERKPGTFWCRKNSSQQGSYYWFWQFYQRELVGVEQSQSLTVDGDQFITFRIRRLRRYKPHNEDVLKLEKRHGIVNCCRITIIIKVTDSFFRIQNKLDTFCLLNQSTSRGNLLFPTLLGEVKQLITEINGFTLRGLTSNGKRRRWPLNLCSFLLILH